MYIKHRTLSVTVFADQPRRFVPPHETELPYFGGNFIDRELVLDLRAFMWPLHLILRTPSIARPSLGTLSQNGNQNT
jgi:hypothetical protein